MNKQASQSGYSPSREQTERLRIIVGDIVQCCQERMLFEAAALDLHQAEIKCLMLFKQERYLTAKGLAERLGVGKSRVTAVLKGLMAKKLLKQIPDPQDGRVKLLDLTRAGRQKLTQIDAFTYNIFAQVLAQLEPQQRNTVLACLEMLWAAMEVVKADRKMADYGS